MSPVLRSFAPRRLGSVLPSLVLALPRQRIGLLGGSFNPPHAAHAHISRVAMKRLGLDQVWWLVTPGNPLKTYRELAPIAERLALARALTRDRRIAVTDLEARLGSPYTANTLAFLRTRYPGVRFVWLMGADNLARFHRWRDWRRIAGLMPIAVLDRPGWRFQALSAPAAQALSRRRIREAQARRLARMNPPAWVFITARLLAVSSAQLRAARATDRFC